MAALDQNAENEEVVQPLESEMGAENEEVAQPLESDNMTPEKLAKMSSEDFQDYLDGLLNSVPDHNDYNDDHNDENVKPAEPTAEDGSDDSGVADEAAADEKSGAHAEALNSDEAPAAPFRTYATEDEYKADVQRQIDSAFGKRFAKDRERNDKFDRFERAARTFYGDGVDALDAATEDMESQAAKRRNQTPEELRSDLELRRDAEAYRAQMRQRDEAAAEKQRIVDAWKRDAAELRNIDPSFELENALKDKLFYDSLAGGKSVFQAYSAMKANQKPPQTVSPKRASIPQNAREVRSGTGGSVSDPSKLNSADFMRYINNIKNR